MNMAMPQNGLNQRKKVTSLSTQGCLTPAPKDPEMEKFYNDLKVAETLHSTAASIIAGI
jgi:hypothetical protein